MSHILKKIIFYLLIPGIFMNELMASQPIFTSQKLTEDSQKAMKSHKVWTDECPVSLDRLRLIQFQHVDFEKNEHVGEIVVLDVAAEAALKVFKKLYELRFPIHKAVPIEAYEGNDERSMKDNNSSCFSFRPITGGGSLSLHSYGTAIDINPVQNPYIAFENNKSHHNATILPSKGCDYINRKHLRPGMVESVEDIKDIFKQEGFTVWGGEWNTPIDWQHFQLTRPLSELLAAMSYKDGQLLFEAYKKDSHSFDVLDHKEANLITLYQKNRATFMKSLKEGFKALVSLPLQNN